MYIRYNKTVLKQITLFYSIGKKVSIMWYKGAVCFLLVAVFVCSCVAETTTPQPSIPCNQNKDCATCIKNVTCLWCNAGNGSCLDYPKKHVIPNTEDCPLSDARWGQCWLNFEALIISLSIIGGLIIILFTWCCCKCCKCCCYKKNHARYAREEAQRQQEDAERQSRYDQRRQDRQMKNDDIRRKYGLTPKYTSSKYQKFDNED